MYKDIYSTKSSNSELHEEIFWNLINLFVKSDTPWSGTLDTSSICIGFIYTPSNSLVEHNRP